MSIGESGPTAGTASSTCRLGAAVLGLLHSHVELFGIELQEQKSRTVSRLLFAVFYTLASIFCGLRLKAAIFDESSPFHGTLEELANDRERLLP